MKSSLGATNTLNGCSLRDTVVCNSKSIFDTREPFDKSLQNVWSEGNVKWIFIGQNGYANI